MIIIGEKYYFTEKRLAQVVEEGRPLSEAYPNLPADILAQLQEEANRRFSTKQKEEKEIIKKKLNNDQEMH